MIRKWTKLLILAFVASCSLFSEKSLRIEKKYIFQKGIHEDSKRLLQAVTDDGYMKLGNYQFELIFLIPDVRSYLAHELINLAPKKEQCFLLKLRLTSVAKENRSIRHWRVFQQLKDKEKVELDLIEFTQGKIVREQQGSSPNYIWYQDGLFCGRLDHHRSTYKMLVTMNISKTTDPTDESQSLLKYSFYDPTEPKEYEKNLKDKKKKRRKKTRNVRFLMGG